MFTDGCASPNQLLQSQLGQIGSQAAAEDYLSKILREYRDAKHRFDNACQAAAKAFADRQDAEAVLQKLSQVLTQAVQNGLHDPTVPEPPQPTANGQYNQAFIGGQALR